MRHCQLFQKGLLLIFGAECGWLPCEASSGDKRSLMVE
jgi:hypothetical protein